LPRGGEVRRKRMAIVPCSGDNPAVLFKPEPSPMPDAAATSSDAPDIAPTTEPAIRTVAMPADCNPHGDIFGGWLLCQMDLAGSTAATRKACGRTVTVAITGMEFHRPVLVGDEVSCYATVEKIGHTSITIRIESWARRGTGTTPIKVTEGVFTYVRVDADGRPQPIASTS